MNSTNTEKKYVPELSLKEIEEIQNSAKSMSLKVVEDNIERMKKTFPNRPQEMDYFDEIANFFGKRQEEIVNEKSKGKKVIGYFCMFAPIVDLITGHTSTGTTLSPNLEVSYQPEFNLTGIASAARISSIGANIQK